MDSILFVDGYYAIPNEDPRSWTDEQLLGFIDKWQRECVQYGHDKWLIGEIQRGATMLMDKAVRELDARTSV